MDWSKSRGLYLINGEPIGKDLITGALAQSREDCKSVLRTIFRDYAADGYPAKEITPILRKEIKDEYIRQYLTGIGGRDAATPSDWGRVGRMLRDQYSYMDGFIKDAHAGNLSEDEIDNRAAHYADASANAYNRAKGLTLSHLDYDEVAWVLGASTDHCDDCLRRSQMGYVPIGPKGGFYEDGNDVVPGDGSSACLFNDQCSLSYRNSTTGEEYEQ